MKLRIKGNSIRLRLSQREVTRLAAGGRIEETVTFGPDQRLMYVVEAADTAERISGRFDGLAVTVTVPAHLAREWAVNEEEGLEAQQAVGNGEPLILMVEKDYQCLKPRDDEADNFVHPDAARGLKC